MSWNHIFIIDPIENLHPQLDSSLRMMFSLWERNHNIFIATIGDLFLETISNSSPKSVFRGALCSQITFDNNATYSNLIFSIGSKKPCDLKFFHRVHMRKDPPFDIDYISATWLLDHLGKNSKVYNRPDALRNSNEKLLIASFPEFIAPFVASSNPSKILPFVKEHKDVILKPLHLFGGRGIKRLISHDQDDKTLLELINREMCDSGQSPGLRLVQPFNPAITQGEIRAFTAFGHPLAWCLKKPKDGEFLANTRAGASLLSMTPTPRLVDIVTKIAKKLQELGIELVGFDIIGESVSEINITSPRMLFGPEDDQKAGFQEFAALCEQDLKEPFSNHE